LKVRNFYFFCQWYWSGFQIFSKWIFKNWRVW